MFMHTAVDDIILDPMRFVSKADNYQVYGALLLEVMTNQKMRDSPAYKTYLSFATGTASPKKERKYKKPASPSRKRTLVIVEEEEPEPAKKFVPSKKPSRKQSIGVQIRDTPGVSVSKKKAPATTDKSKGIHLLSEAALIKEAPVKKALKRRVPDVPKTDSSESEINKELYGDVNVSLTDVEQDDGDEEDADMTDVAHVQVEQTQEQTMGVQEESGPEMASVQGQYVVQATTTATPAIYNATIEVPLLSSSHSVSSTYTNAFLNLKNLHSTKMEVVSMLDINVQHKVPRTSPLLTILVSVIPKHTVFNPSETNLKPSMLSILDYQTWKKKVKELKNVDHSSALLSKIKSEVPNAVKEYLGTSLDDALYKVLKKHDADIIKGFLVHVEIVERLT
ncbi:hypothetical protein Tco_0367089 [Tanacetum coccineum]